MATVNKLASFSFLSISWNSSVSLPTLPSVIKTTWRKKLSSVLFFRARFKAGTISVPPSACNDLTNWWARAIFLALAFWLCPNSSLAVELNSTILNLSRLFKRLRASSKESLACLIDVPDIEPEVSIINIISRAIVDCIFSNLGGTSMTSA